MVSPLTRRRAPIHALAAAAALALSALALLTPSAARAGTVGEQCSGSSIEGSIASPPQLVAQFLWAPAFNTSPSLRACSGTQGSGAKPAIRYEAAGLGMEAWGANGHAFEGSRIAFVGTDEAPDAQQRTEIQSHSANPAVNTLETIPVMQDAVAILVDLPTGCHATSTPFPGRLVLGNATLQKIFRGVIAKWSEITESGDQLTGEKCEASSAITRVVRESREAPTSILKRYLGAIHAEHDIVSGLGWRELASPEHSTEWPGSVTRASGDRGEAEAVAATRGSIGYADLAYARAEGSFTTPSGGKGFARFWAPIQDNGVALAGARYNDPSTDGETTETANANCADTAYSNGSSSSPPASTLELWNEVGTTTKEPAYPLCGLSYELAFDEYSQYPGTTLREATTANNYVRFTVAINGGQELIKKHHDYQLLPASLKEEIANGAQKIGD